jgi:hypothetical protein
VEEVDAGSVVDVVGLCCAVSASEAGAPVSIGGVGAGNDGGGATGGAAGGGNAGMAISGVEVEILGDV